MGYSAESTLLSNDINLYKWRQGSRVTCETVSVQVCVCVCASMCLCILQCHQGHSDKIIGMLVHRLKVFSGTCVVSGSNGRCLTTTDIAKVT